MIVITMLCLKETIPLTHTLTSHLIDTCAVQSLSYFGRNQHSKPFKCTHACKDTKAHTTLYSISHRHTHTYIHSHRYTQSSFAAPPHPAPHNNIRRLATTNQKTRSPPDLSRLPLKSNQSGELFPWDKLLISKGGGEGNCGGLVNNASVSAAQTSLSYSLSSFPLCFYVLLTWLLMSKHSNLILVSSIPLSRPLAMSRSVGGTL